MFAVKHRRGRAMASQHKTMRVRRSRNAKVRRRRVTGIGASAGVLLAAAMTPLAAAPVANADFGFDDLLDLLDPGLVVGTVDPTVGLESLLSDFGLTTTPLPEFDLNAVALPVAAPVLAQQFDMLIYEPIHAAEQAFIASPFGQAFDNAVNPFFESVFGRDLIGNGADGVAGGTLAQANGGDGGLLFGDGGNGATSANTAGSLGSTATAVFGNGDFASVVGDDSFARAGGTSFDVLGNNDIAQVFDLGAEASQAAAGASVTDPGNFDLSVVVGEMLNSTAATGGDFLVDILP